MFALTTAGNYNVILDESQAEALDLMTLRMRDYNQPQVWRQTLFILLQQTGENKEIALDTLRLMRATKSMLQRPEYSE